MPTKIKPAPSGAEAKPPRSRVKSTSASASEPGESNRSASSGKTASPGRPAARRSGRNPASAKGSSPPRRKRQSVQKDPWDMPDDDPFGGDAFGDDPYSNDLYGADSYGDDLDSYDDGYEDTYTSSKPALPSRKKKSGTTSRSESGVKSSGDQPRNQGFLGWLLYGSLAGVIAAIIHTVLGYTDIFLLALLATFLTGSMVGGAVRFSAGINDGWGPGLTAAAIAIVSIVGGRIGSCYVSPTYGLDMPLSEEEVDALIAEGLSEKGMVGYIAENEVEYDDDWLQSKGITDDNIYDHWEEYAEVVDIQQRYLPQVWEESTRRWNSLTEEQKAKKRQEQELDLHALYGLETDESVGREQVQTFRLLLVVGIALISLFLGVGTIFCTCSSIWGAFKLGAGMASS
ncbi:MAG: hypothetical protein KDA91_23060 [Planctomycetaceae bacterium]|nr:hypothetical protein [Planctomycetaceae bacterium]